MVGSTPCGLRSKSLTPSAYSRPAITSDTLGAVTPSCAAALAMLPRSATAKNTWRSRSFSRRPSWLSQSTLRGIRKTPSATKENQEFRLIRSPYSVGVKAVGLAQDRRDRTNGKAFPSSFLQHGGKHTDDGVWPVACRGGAIVSITTD